MSAFANTLERLSEPGRKITYGVVKPGPEVEDGIRFIRGGDVFQGRIAENELRTISPQLSGQYKRTILKGGELVVSLVGTPGEVAVVPDSLAGANIARQVGLVPLGPKVNSHFAMYFLRSHRGRAQLFTRTQGAVQQVINLADLKTVEIPDVSLDVQNHIASILSAYDDLIENNRRRIELLEQAARLLYKEWFVHLRFPGHEHVTITDGVPEGWERKRLTEIAEFRLGKMLDQRKNRGDLMPYLANLNVRWGEFDFDNLREMRFEQHELDRFGLKYGDIVMCEGGEPGRCAIWKEQIPGMMIQKAIHRIRPHQDLDHRFLYYSLLHKGKSGRLAMLFTGATIKHLPREKLAKVEIEIPPARVTNLFLEQVGPIEDQIDVLQTCITRASEGRDLLLPRLMNGEIAV